MIVDKIPTCLTENEAVPGLHIWNNLSAGLMWTMGNANVNIQNKWPVCLVWDFLSVCRQDSEHVKQWYFGFSDATVRRPVVCAVTTSGLVYGARDTTCLRKPLLNCPAVWPSLRTVARCSSSLSECCLCQSQQIKKSLSKIGTYHSQRRPRTKGG